MKKLFAITISLLSVISGFSQEQTDKIKFKPYGFVRNYLCYDSRQSLNLMGETYSMMPLDENWNEDRTEDLNAVSELSFTAFNTRFGVDISGQTIGAAQVLAKVEADFCGYGSNNTLFRIRQAYVSLKWERATLTCGQTWHPMVIQVMPSVTGFSPGSPFAPFNRSPQLNYSINLGKGWNFTAAALYQVPNTSVGPEGASYDYSRWSKIPELYASLKHASRHFTIGAGVDFLSIMPRKESIAIREDEQVKVIANDRVTGVSSEIFADYKYGKFNLKGKVLYGENTSHLTMISGYGAVDYNPQTGSYEYAPIRSVSSWVNASYGSKVQGSLFLGYSKCLGAKQDFISTNDFWMRGAKNTDYIYRVSPSVTYTIKNLALALELDYTVVGYGDVAINGRTKALRDIGNLRVCTMVKYSF
jgi:hypothetical protein